MTTANTVTCSDGEVRDRSACVIAYSGDYIPIGEARWMVCCGRYAHRDDDNLVALYNGDYAHINNVSSVDDEYYLSDDVVECQICRHNLLRDDSWSSPDDDEYLCEGCVGDHTSCCDCCGDRCWDDDIEDDDDGVPCCERCRSRVRSLIRGYGDKSANHKQSETKDYLRYGVELEVEHKLCSETGAKYVSGFLDKDYVTFKRDGSLGHTGFEIVTRPDSIDVHKRKFKALFDDKPGRQLTSWSNGRCGMHVHITKSALSQLQLGKMLCFLNEAANTPMISKIAGRKPGRWCHVYRKKITDINRPEERYVALNITERTAEVRIFRGTLSQSGFFKNLEFVQALVEFCAPANRSIRDAVSYVEFCKWLPRKTYPTLHKFLVERGYITWNHKRKAG